MAISLEHDEERALVKKSDDWQVAEAARNKPTAANNSKDGGAWAKQRSKSLFRLYAGLAILFGPMWILSYINAKRAEQKVSELEMEYQPPSNSNSYKRTITDVYAFCTDKILAPAELNPHSDEVEMWYQCDGDEYYRFGKKLHQLVRNKVTNEIKPSTWGRRGYPIPAGKTVVVFGNSHSRQVAHSLACQYGMERVQEVKVTEPELIDPNTALRIDFTNESTLWVIANSYAAYSDDWKGLLEKQIGVSSLSDEVDAVLIGVFNPCSGVSNFYNYMLNMSASIPGVNCEPKQRLPYFKDVIDVFDGPVGQLDMFTPRGSVNTKRAQKWIKESQKENRTNLDTFIFRDYIEEIGLEGASPARIGVNECINDETGSRAHRCIGSMGGYPDLIAWDVSEFLYKYLS